MSDGRNPKRQRHKESRQARIERELKEQKARKRRSTLIGVGLVILIFGALAAQARSREATGVKTPKKAQAASPGPTQFATFVTSLGDIKVRLLSETAPKTVENFVGLATGQKEWTDPKTSQKTKTPLYNGTIFHRVIPGFMVQGGDPLGTGLGGPGYQFEDETKGGPKFDKPGLLAMANSGPNTNGSQFFITVGTPTYLNGIHTVFGEVVEGQPVVEAISKVPTVSDKPVNDVVLKEVRITSD